MGNVWKFLLLAVGCIIVVGLITLSLRISNKGESDTSKNLEVYSRLAGDAEDMKLKRLDETEVKGSEIKEFIREYKKDDYLSIKVINGKKDTEDYLHSSTINNRIATIGAAVTTAISEDPAESNYINDAGIFKAEVIYDHNDVIACVRFTQK